MRFRSDAAAVGLVACALAAALARGQPGSAGFDPLQGSMDRDEPPLVYSADRSHLWNRLFHLLFTRTLRVRVAGADDARRFMQRPATVLAGPIVMRIESGDRAIDPLYPSWVWMGSTAFDMSTPGMWGVLADPRYAAVVAALEELPSSASMQPPLARALMQADLWAVFDLLYEMPARPRASQEEDGRIERVGRLRPLLVRAMRSLALSQADIAALPDNYSLGRRVHGLPDLFAAESGWLELRQFPVRQHETAVHDRRAARVFVKPAQPLEDEAAALDRLGDSHGEHLFPLEAAALVIQTLLIGTEGSVVASPITYDVQLMRFNRDPRGGRAEIFQYELSRQRLLESIETGGLTALDGLSPAYLPIAGNDLSFAAPPRLGGEPLLVSLRQRCTACHGPTLEHLASFSMTAGPGRARPSVVRLRASEHRHPRDVAARKMTRSSWTALHSYW